MTPTKHQNNHHLSCNISASLWQALQEQSIRSGESISHIVRTALAEALDLDHHTIFQVSTSGALVQGVYQGCVSIADLKRHGDFGLGTFEGLDGEMILLEGQCYQICSDGIVNKPSDTWLVPFAVVSHFVADQQQPLVQVRSWADLCGQIDHLRPSNNVFVGIRLHGVMDRIQVRVACKSEPGIDLVTATSHQAEFTFEKISGTLVGFWTPAYARAINVPGYHLHFLSDDRQQGGHVLDLQACNLELALHLESDFHMAIPETSAFLSADLSGDPSDALAMAESKRH